MPKLHVKKGDTVKVLSGNSKGQEGKVIEVLIARSRAIVEGVNMVSKHSKPNGKGLPLAPMLKEWRMFRIR